jgi:hypothetical protein
MAAIRAIPEAARSRRSINACWEERAGTHKAAYDHDLGAEAVELIRSATEDEVV